jgi:hypothetical protein
MAVFQTGKMISQNTPVIQVDVTPTAPLPVGVHRFQLVVVDEAGNASTAATIDVAVKASAAPTAVLIMVNADGNRIDPPVVPFGQSFSLSAAQSIDTGGGRIVEYRFTLLT